MSASVVAPPSARSFALPLPSEHDQSHLSSRVASAVVSRTASASVSARRAATQAFNATRKRASVSEAAAAQATAASDSPAPTQAMHGFTLTPSVAAHPADSGSADRARVEASLSALAAAAAPTTTGQSPHAMPMERRGSSDAHVLQALAEAMRAEAALEAEGSLEAGAAMLQPQADSGAPLSPSAPSTARRAMPTLPPAQLCSLVRSHVRHVGLSARLKTRAHVRELIEEQRHAKARSLLHAKAAPHPGAAHAGHNSSRRHASVSPGRREEEKEENRRARGHSTERARGGAGRRRQPAPASEPAEESMRSKLGLGLDWSSPAPTAPPAAAPVAPPPVVSWPSWLPESGRRAAPASSLDSSSEPAPDSPDGHPIAWKDRFGNVIGHSSECVPRSPAREWAPTTTLHPNQQQAAAAAHPDRTHDEAMSARMPTIRPARGHASKANSNSRLLKGSFAPPQQPATAAAGSRRF